ncbi:MAG: aspartate aminotransferase family protein [Candidatus Bipolaricaulis sp.]|nr:aspartate aminotransferase family protein [Candidatus Bipolaricaulis sp.]
MMDDYLAQRKRMQISQAEIDRRIADAPFGPTSKKWASRWLSAESWGQVGLALFDLPPIVERAENDLLIDADGKEYVDLLAGFSVSSLGQCNKEIAEVIRNQAGTLVHYFDLPHPERIKLAERLKEISPTAGGDSRVLFGVTGADAIELAVRAARFYTGRPMILTAFGDYHGVTYSTMALTGKGGMWAYFYPVLPHCEGVGYFPFPYPYQSPFGRPPAGEDDQAWCLDRLRDYFEYYFRSKESPYREVKGGITNVAAFVVEPFQSSAGYILPSAGYLKLLRRLADEYGILLIVDEIQTGLGRTGKLWASDWEDVRPDMLVTSKALGGGLPLSAVVARADILEAWGPGAHVSTQAGNVLACAAGNKALELLTANGFLDKVRADGAYFEAGLTALAKKHPLIGHINARGMYIGLELVRNRDTREPAPDEAGFILKECVREGMVFEKGGYFHNRFQLIPPLTIRRSTIDRALGIFDRVFAAAERKFGR